MKLYRILKDIPGFRAGEVFRPDFGVLHIYDVNNVPYVSYKCAKFPEWFEEIVETKKEYGFVYTKSPITYNGKDLYERVSDD